MKQQRIEKGAERSGEAQFRVEEERAPEGW